MLSYKDSVMAPRDTSHTEWYYNVDDDIGVMTIENVLMCLCHNSYGFKKEKPTKEELRAALKKIKKEWLDMFEAGSRLMRISKLQSWYSCRWLRWIRFGR
jgi:hypothetical protein